MSTSTRVKSVSSLGHVSPSAPGGFFISKLFINRHYTNRMEYWRVWSKHCENRRGGLDPRLKSTAPKSSARFGFHLVMPQGTGPIQILLVDNQLLTRVGLRLLIESWEEMRVIGDTGDESEALVLARQADIILVELDYRLGKSALSLLNKLTATSKAPVIMLTHLQDVDLHHLALRFGARGLVLKDRSPEQFRRAILEVYRGEVWLDDRLTTSIITRMAQPNRVSPQEQRSASLTLLSSREREVARLAGDGLSNKDIATRLFISETTVRHHMTAVFRKLRVASRLELVISLLRPASKKASFSETFRNFPEGRGADIVAVNESGRQMFGRQS